MAKVIIFSGAGLSAESGISTFRDSGGLWEKHSVYDVCSADSLKKNRELTLSFYNERRQELKNILPNYVHKCISKLKDKYNEDICVITQNVDDLFERENCETIHLHGFLTSLRCPNKECNYKIDIGYNVQQDEKCVCGQLLRPDIVFFGEEAPNYQRLYKELKDCEMLVVIGTSGEVIDVNFLRRGIKHSILNNLEPSRTIKSKKFSKVLYKPATKAIDEIIKDISNYIDGKKVVTNLKWEEPTWPPRPIKREAIFSLIRQGKEIYFVNESNRAITKLNANSGGFVGEASVSDVAGISYEDIQAGEAVLLDTYDMINDSDFYLGLYIVIESESYGKMKLSSNVSRGGVSTQALLYSDGYSPRGVSIERIKEEK